MAGGDRKLILDACVLIDFLEQDAAVLAAASRSIGRIIVPTPLLLEVRQLTETLCGDLGFTLAEPDLSVVRTAAVRGGGLSSTDRLCLLMAKDLGATLYSNDKPLIGAAIACGVDARWGLELLLELVGAGMEGEAALEAATRICGRSSYNQRALEPFLREFASICPHLVDATREVIN